MPQAIPNNNMPMNAAADPLSQLKDIHLPDPITTWPPAIGWWLLMLVVFVILVFLVRRLSAYYKKNAYRRQALVQLETLEKSYNQSEDKPLHASNINKLLKQVAANYYPKKEVSSLTGKPWLSFLDHSADTTDFTQGAGQILGTAQYQATADFDIEPLTDCCKKWLKHHA